jgi:hypothetical protein
MIKFAPEIPMNPPVLIGVDPRKEGVAEGAVVGSAVAD